MSLLSLGFVTEAEATVSSSVRATSAILSCALAALARPRWPRKQRLFAHAKMLELVVTLRPQLCDAMHACIVEPIARLGSAFMRWALKARGLTPTLLHRGVTPPCHAPQAAPAVSRRRARSLL